MKIWDCYPAYLNQNLLVAEHRELHGLQQISNRKTPITKATDAHIAAWISSPNAMSIRHDQIVEEMHLHQIEHRSPMPRDDEPVEWPPLLQQPSVANQFSQLREVSSDARLAVPEDSETLIEQFAFSLMARDPALYKRLQAQTAQGDLSLDELMVTVSETLQLPVDEEVYQRVISTMWRYCAKAPEAFTFASSVNEPRRRLRAIQYLASKYKWPELWKSTALTDLATCQIVKC
ncbi:pyrimidine dimer DNA glycosylase/endonuclease V [Echinimonas agarilytica]|uniref:Pyrimidine dimer DNA glycosylase/endonuclease V n=1 Tax=Echinimonas agarilytica TaxID=1215918 RepID=A0AA41W6F2_9GAMM|nr:pyrimidine dimer DNA glycosylase/endonuclease V [Echinimonas agarilytica]MCM2679471.1 pyrimidine dimer DNA glycosylase/endonuclease V [Echinimonas agarilytica]